MSQLLLKYKFSILVAASIFYLCARSNIPPVLDVIKNNEVCIDTDSVTLSYRDLRDHLGHFFLYVIFSFVLASESYRDGVGMCASKMRLLVLLVPSLYGGLIEVLQELFFPNRGAEWMDWFEDIGGTFIGYFSACVCLPRISCLNNK